MNLHEYQAKQLFAEYGLPVGKGFACKTAKEAVEAAKKIGGNSWVVKCQVHAGGRGKAGGVNVVNNKEEINAFCERWLGKRLVTSQSGVNGQPVEWILVESCSPIAHELYLGAVIDRSRGAIVVMASLDGGVDIETIAHNTPDRIHQVVIDPLVGPQPYQGRELGFKLALSGDQIKQFTNIFMGLGKLFLEKDLSLVEINPLVITPAGSLLCLDGKINIDSNALYRQQQLREMYDSAQDDPREAEASEWQLNYVALDGNIGCMVNGAGLAMGTMDMVHLHGGAPANFLDVGGGATKERVAHAFKIILSDEKVKAVLVNIFGGIVRCDMIADGIINAIKEVGVNVPVVVRLEGNNAELGRAALIASGLNVLAATSLSDAAKQVVSVAGGRG